MRSAKSMGVAAATAIVASAALVIGSSGAAHAATSPPWEPDQSATGTVAFYDASGTVITGGSINDNPMAAYAVASAPVRAGDTRAVLDEAQPNPNSSPPSLWNNDQLSAVTTFPVTAAGAPASIKSLTTPVVTGAGGDLNLSDFIGEFPNTDPTGAGCAYAATPSGCTNTAYQNIYQLRIKTLNTDGVLTDNYATADILVSGTTWTQIYPVTGAPTTTTLTVAPTGSASEGDSVTLTATTALGSDSTVHPAGTVQFKENGATVGDPATVDTTTGIATLATTALTPTAPDGAALTATFTPTDTADAPSTSTAVTYTVNPVAAKPKITGTVKTGDTVTCKATLTSAEKATYEFDASGKKVGAKSKLTIPGSANGKKLTCTVSVKIGSGSSSSATSAASKVGEGKLKTTKKPTLSGKGKVGAKEKVKPGKWSAKAKYSYQWLLNGKKIKHATKSSFKPVKNDGGKKLSCRVTAKASGFTSGSATTKAVKLKK